MKDQLVSETDKPRKQHHLLAPIYDALFVTIFTLSIAYLYGFVIVEFTSENADFLLTVKMVRSVLGYFNLFLLIVIFAYHYTWKYRFRFLSPGEALAGFEMTKTSKVFSHVEGTSAMFEHVFKFIALFTFLILLISLITDVEMRWGPPIAIILIVTVIVLFLYDLKPSILRRFAEGVLFIPILLLGLPSTILGVLLHLISSILGLASSVVFLVRRSRPKDKVSSEIERFSGKKFLLFIGLPVLLILSLYAYIGFNYNSH